MAKNKKDELGKGLRALISNIDKKPVQEETSPAVSSASVSDILIKYIEANPFQPRTEFNQEELLELVQSIKVNGLIQPITVRKLSEKKFQIIAGERRFRASKLAGLKTMPCYIRSIEDEAVLELALIENIQRSDLNPMEVAISYKRLIDELRYSQEELADRVGKKRSTVTNFLRILKLSPEMQQALKTKSISMGHAKALLSVEEPSRRNSIFNQILSQGLSVRAAEALVKELKADPSSPKPKAAIKNDALSVQIRHLETKVSEQLGTKVRINRNHQGKGSIQIQFNSDDMLSDIIEYFE